MIGLHVTLTGFTAIDYDKKKVRLALRQEARPIRDIARQLLSRRGTSAPGEAPGMQTGLLRRSVKSTALRGELAVVIEASRRVLTKVRGTKDAGYPWILMAGSASIAKRDDVVDTALLRRTEAATAALRSAMQAALVPR